MPRLTAVYIDFQDRGCWRAWRWLSSLPQRGTFDVRPFPTDTTGMDGGPWDRTVPSSAGLELLALGELARESGPDVHLAFVDAAFAAAQDEDADMTSLEAWLALGSKLGLDLDTFTADSERWRAEVGLWHAEAKDDFGVREVPTLLFADDGGDEHALFVQLVRDVRADEGRRLLADLADLVAQPVGVVRRGR